MKTTLHFDLPEHNEEFYLALNGHRYRSVIQDVFQELRQRDKRGGDKMTPNEIRQVMVKKLEENDVEV